MGTQLRGNSQTNAVVIGYGSIGSRHARLLDELGATVSVVSRRDVDVPRRFASLDAALSATDPAYVVIANRTSEHHDALKDLIDVGFSGRVLVEKPLFDTPDVSNELIDAAPNKTYVGYNLRFHPTLQALREVLDGERPISAHVYAGQYLPTWRPGVDYRDSYSAHSDQGGGVLRDLSHELDYLNWLFGGWTDVAAHGGQFSNLEVTSDDIFALLLSYPKCPAVTLQVNYLDRGPHRSIRLNTSENTYSADLITGILRRNGAILDEVTLGRDDTYLTQHRAVLEGRTGDLCTLDEGHDVLRLVAAAERAAVNQTWISSNRTLAP